MERTMNEEALNAKAGRLLPGAIGSTLLKLGIKSPLEVRQLCPDGYISLRCQPESRKHVHPRNKAEQEIQCEIPALPTRKKTNHDQERDRDEHQRNKGNPEWWRGNVGRLHKL
jgi:hypothetical protein